MSDFVDFSVLLDEDDEEDEEYIPVEEEDDEDDEDEEAVPVTEPEHESEAADVEDLIARRTRSKFQIDGVAGDTLQLPDVELDLYDLSEGDDLEWTGFCKALFADDPVPDADDDDENDPEYVAGDHVRHFHDKDDSAIAISSEEVDSVLDDVSAESLASPIHDATEWSACFTSRHLEQLKDQFAMYLQLLTQHYFLCRERETLLQSAFDCVGKVAEIRELSESCAVADVENLVQVIDLIRANPIKSVSGKYERYSWRKCSITAPVRSIIVQNPGVFVCERLIPQHGYYDVNLKSSAKVSFFASEDDLIILGIENFKKHGNPVVRRRYLKFIRDLILPSKTESQIRTRIKNCSRRFDPDNRLSVYLRNGTVPASVPIPVNRRKTSFVASQCPDWLQSSLRSSARAHPVASPPTQRSSQKLRSLLPSARSQNDPFRKASNIIRKYKIIQNRQKAADAAVDPKPAAETEKIAYKLEKTVDEAVTKEIVAMDAVPDAVSEVGQQSQESEAEPQKEVDEEEDGEDDESELAALMAASSTITTNKMKLKKVPVGKQGALNKQKEISRKVLRRDWDVHDPDQELRQQTIVENFMQKARDVLHSEHDFIQFLRLLSEFHESRQAGQGQSVKQVFQNLESFLTSVRGEKLIDDLILFLDHREAVQCGKVFEYLYWKRFTSFMRKIEISTTVDSQILMRLFKTLTQLKQNPFSIDKNRIKTAVSKAVNGHPLLMAEFMNLFLDEEPAAHLFADEQDFDHVVCNSDEDNEDCCFEGSAPIPSDNDAAYGTKDCPCTHCHRSPGQKVKHCARCRISVIDNQLHIVVNGKAVAATLDYNEKVAGKRTSGGEERISPKGRESPLCKKQKAMDEWTPEDDAILLLVVQQKLSSTDLIEKHVFEDIAKQVNKTFDQVSARFSALMQVIRDLPSPEKHVNTV